MKKLLLLSLLSVAGYSFGQEKFNSLEPAIKNLCLKELNNSCIYDCKYVDLYIPPEKDGYGVLHRLGNCCEVILEAKVQNRYGVYRSTTFMFIYNAKTKSTCGTMDELSEKNIEQYKESLKRVDAEEMLFDLNEILDDMVAGAGNLNGLHFRFCGCE